MSAKPLLPAMPVASHLPLMASLLRASALALALGAGLQGCVPVLATGAVVGVLSATDRRTVGAQTEDESIGWKVVQIASRYGDRAHINGTSYNRKLVLTGEVPDEATKAEVVAAARAIPNVREVWDELVIGFNSSHSSRVNDAYVTSKVRGRFVDSSQFSVNHVKAFTEAKVVYLLGLLTAREASAVTEVARSTAGVSKVVSLIEIISDAEARRLDKTGSGEKTSGAGQN